MESDEYEASMGMLKYMQPPVLLFAFAKLHVNLVREEDMSGKPAHQ